MANKTTTARSLQLLRDRGWDAQIVEHYNPWARIKRDLFHFIDIVAIDKSLMCKGVLGVQSTTAPNVHARVKKIFELDSAVTWLRTGNHIEVHGWKKIKKGSPRISWRPLIYNITLTAGGLMQAEDISFYY